jgi:predicted ATPase
LLETLKNRLRDKRMLLVLDDCEHVVTARAQLVHALLMACQSLSILATSREPLGLETEVSWRVPPVQLPKPERAPTIDSILDRRRFDYSSRAHIRPGFQSTGNAQTIAEICRRLDSIPLAIELAAARTGMMTPEQLAAALDDRFRLLVGSTRTTVPRQQTLRPSVDWSHDLLADERTSWRSGGA